MPDKISCAKAKSLGLDRYFTGKPCKRGHLSERRVLGRCCIECANKISTDWQRANPKRQREISRSHYKRNRESELSRARKYREENPEKRNLSIANWRENNKERYRAIVTAAASRRRAAEIMASPQWVENCFGIKLKIQNIYRRAQEMTANTGIKHHVDHIIPLRGKNVSGLHVPWNLQILTADENRRKSNRVLT